MTKISNNRNAIEIGGSLGAIIDGMRLDAFLHEDDISYISEMLGKYRVLFFKNQNALTNEGQLRFASAFGEIVSHPTVSAEADPSILELHSHRGGRANSWHTDVTFELRPPRLSVLRAVTLPKIGGDTVWANTVQAYNTLPEHLKRLADMLWGVHGNDFDYAASRVELLHDEISKEYRKRYASQIIKTEHPVVRVHPQTGERSLLLGHYTQRFVGLNTFDSDRLYEIFQSYVTRLENTIRWRWSSGDVAMWDNQATQHYAINDYGEQVRVMRRVTVKGTVPVDISGRLSRPHNP